MREKVDAGAVTLDKFVIHKQLTKRPEDYPDAKNQPHVQVALRRAAAHKRDGTKQVLNISNVTLDDAQRDMLHHLGLLKRVQSTFTQHHNHHSFQGNAFTVCLAPCKPHLINLAWLPLELVQGSLSVCSPC